MTSHNVIGGGGGGRDMTTSLQGTNSLGEGCRTVGGGIGFGGGSVASMVNVSLLVGRNGISGGVGGLDITTIATSYAKETENIVKYHLTAIDGYISSQLNSTLSPPPTKMMMTKKRKIMQKNCVECTRAHRQCVFLSTDAVICTRCNKFNLSCQFKYSGMFNILHYIYYSNSLLHLSMYIVFFSSHFRARSSE